MPKYSFQCQECNVRFERALLMATHLSHPCPQCKEPAPRAFDEFGFTFSQGGTAPANSGVHTHDYPTADRAVGRSADVRWEHLTERQKAKQQAREMGATHALIRHTGDGYIDYEPMPAPVRKARAQLAKSIFNKANKEPPR